MVLYALYRSESIVYWGHRYNLTVNTEVLGYSVREKILIIPCIYGTQASKVVKHILHKGFRLCIALVKALKI